MTSTSTARPSLHPPDAHPARQTLAVVTTPMSRYRPQGLASSHKTKTQASSFSQARHPFRTEASPEHPRGKDCCLTREIPGSSQAILLVLSSRRLLDDSACSHRLRGLPSSAGSPSRLHLRALAPERLSPLSGRERVEPQPPTHASSVVA